MTTMARATAAPVPVMTKTDEGGTTREGQRQGSRQGDGAGKAARPSASSAARGARASKARTQDGTKVKGLTWERRFTHPGIHPYDEIEWELRTAAIASETGKTVFEQKDVEVPRAGASSRPTSS